METILVNPLYLPDIIYTASVVQADKTIFEYCGNYQKQSFRNRTYIGTANGKLLLNIPVRHGTSETGHKKTAEALIENSFLWQRQHWRSIQIAYRTSPFFEFYEDDIAPLYKQKFEKLIDFNEASIAFILDALQIELNRSETSSYKENYDSLTDLRFLANAKRKNKEEIPAYPQVFQEKTGFIPHLSVIDLIFNQGPAALSYLENLKLDFQ